MKRKLQVTLSEESWNLLEGLTKDSNAGFKNGFISCSDIVNEMILNAKVDIRSLQAKHTNIRKSLRLMASQKDIDIDLAIKSLLEMKSRGAKKPPRIQSSFDEQLN